MNIDNAVTAGLKALSAQSTNRPDVWDAMTVMRAVPRMVEQLQAAAGFLELFEETGDPDDRCAALPAIRALLLELGVKS
jgi:hypothetical protein